MNKCNKYWFKLRAQRPCPPFPDPDWGLITQPLRAFFFISHTGLSLVESKGKWKWKNAQLVSRGMRGSFWLVQTIFFIDYSWREEKVVFAVLKIMRGGVLYKEGVCICFYKRGLVFYKKGKGSFKNSKNLFLLQEWFLVRSTIGNHGFSIFFLIFGTNG